MANFPSEWHNLISISNNYWNFTLPICEVSYCRESSIIGKAHQGRKGWVCRRKRRACQGERQRNWKRLSVLENGRNNGANVTHAPLWRSASSIMRLCWWVFNLVNGSTRGPRMEVGGLKLNGNNPTYPHPWPRAAGRPLCTPTVLSALNRRQSHCTSQDTMNLFFSFKGISWNKLVI